MEKFTWFPKFGEAMMRIPDERMRERFAYAVAVYGCTGEVVELSWPLDAIFAACVEDIDNSKQMADAGRASGRARRTRRDAQPAGDVREDARAAFAQTDEQCSQSRANDVREKARTNPIQSIPIQSIPKGVDAPAPDADPLGEPVGAARPGGAYPHPSPEQVEAYVAANGGHPISGEDFVGHYDSVGWPARDWRPKAMRWSRDERDRAAMGRASPSQGAAQAAQARREAAELGRRYGEAERTEEVR